MAETKPARTVFFTELDAILDTRMGTLMRVSPKEVASILKAGYLHRDRDKFPGVDVQRFQEAYKNRDRKILQASMMTPMIWFLTDFCKTTFQGNAETPFLRDPVIVINTYPYQLLESETLTIQRAILARVKHISSIEFVRMSYREISPAYLRQEVQVISIYDPYEWLEVQSSEKRFEKDSCPLVNLAGPLMFRNVDVTGVKLSELQKTAELMCKPFIDLNLLPMQHYSVDILPRKSTPPEEKAA